MNRKTAILYAGSAYNLRFSLESQLKNLVEPNDADVFIVTTRAMKRRKTPHDDYIPKAEENDLWVEKVSKTIVDDSPLTDQEIQLIKDTFGERLKGFFIVEENEDYMNYLREERQKMADIVNWYIDESAYMKKPLPFGGGKFKNANNDQSNGTIRCTTDQYNHIKKCYELMERYENERGEKYEWVVRARIDFIVPFEFNLKHYYENQDKQILYICGSFRQEVMSWLDEFFWFSKRITAEKLFPKLNRMGMINNRKHNTLQYGTAYAPNGNDLNFDPEVQFSLLLYEIGLNELINIKIYRSSRYTNGNDGYDYFNYEFQRAKIDLEHEFNLVKNYETDINEHADVLRNYASQCAHVTEFGIRFGNSSIMLFCGRPQKMVSYDVFKEERVNYLELIAKDCEINWELRIENPSPEDATESKIEETDLLFIDTNHYAQQLELELRLHAPKTRKFIILHDTEVFGARGAGDDHINDGMNLAIEPFLKNNPQWKVREKFTNNNGLTVFERVSL
jgi:cephalosporin hydroxylase